MKLKVTVINSGGQGHYMIGFVNGLADNNVSVDVIDSEDTRDSFVGIPNVRHYSFIKWSGFKQPIYKKIVRVLLYPFLLLFYLLFTNSDVIHMQWEGRQFKSFYRYFIPILCRVRRKKLVLTVHNVNAQCRDTGRTDAYTVKSLSYLYSHCDGLIAHTKSIKEELLDQFDLASERIHVVPHGSNNAVKTTALSCSDARQQLGLPKDAKVLLLFGGFRRSKNYELLISAMPQLLEKYPEVITVIAGDIANVESYYNELFELVESLGISKSIRFYPGFVPDEMVEVYFKAANAVVLPYKSISMTGIPFMAFMFGLPVIASRIGGLPELVVDGKYGLLFESENIHDLQMKLVGFFESELYSNPSKKTEIHEYVNREFAWSEIGRRTIEMYNNL